ncbi:MAG: hypothetical protein WCS43_02375 [Verrucomicrobiota bacterium]
MLETLSPTAIPQISLGTAVLIVFLICAGFVMLRGITRMIVGSVVLALSAWLAFLVWQKAPALSVEWFGKSIGFVTTGLPIVTFLASFLLIRKIIKLITSPFERTADEEKKSSNPFSRLVFRLFLALIPTSIICLIAAALVHHSGSIAEVRDFSEKTDSAHGSAPAKKSQSLKSSIEAVLPATWIEALDPLANPMRITLAKVIASQSEFPVQPVIDPRTGKPIPRAILVDDPELQNLAREGKYGTLLRHPLLTKALADPDTQAFLKNLHL